MSIKCLIIGISGQTGSYLAWESLRNNFEVIGTTRDKENLNMVNLNKLKLDINKIKIISLEPSDPRQVFSCLLKNMCCQEKYKKSRKKKEKKIWR